MAGEKKFIFTKEGYEKLLKELEYRKNELREKLRDTVADMREKGDLSENDGYTLAIEENQANETEIALMEEKVKHAEIVEGKKDGKVQIGECVTLKNDKDDTKEYQLVGEDEADPMDGKISFKSPIGKAIMGKKKDQKVVIETPAGKTEWVIVNIC